MPITSAANYREFLLPHTSGHLVRQGENWRNYTSNTNKLSINCLAKIIPDCKYEGQYLHPGPYHTEQAGKLRGELPEWCLNTDGHIRSCLLGRSESIPLVDGAMTLGEFGLIYFADLDQTRERDRTVRVQIVGE